MRWWLRLVLTLVFGPSVWWIVTGYVVTQQGTTFDQWLNAVPKILPEVYLVYTLPALLLCVILLGIDRLLRLASLDFFTIVVSPVVAFGLAWAAVRFIPEPHVKAAGAALPLFAVYGLVWGLTIREPRWRHDRDGATTEMAALVPPPTCRCPRPQAVGLTKASNKTRVDAT